MVVAAASAALAVLSFPKHLAGPGSGTPCLRRREEVDPRLVPVPVPVQVPVVAIEVEMSLHGTPFFVGAKVVPWQPCHRIEIQDWS